MNPAAILSYAKRGGDKLIGRSVLECHNPESRQKIQQVIDWFAADESHNIVYTFHNEKQNKDVYMVALRNQGRLIGYYEKHEYRNVETMKSMFFNCDSLQSIKMSNFSNEKVTNMDFMFSGCSSLNSLDLSKFYTNNVKNMQRKQTDRS